MWQIAVYIKFKDKCFIASIYLFFNILGARFAVQYGLDALHHTSAM